MNRKLRGVVARRSENGAIWYQLSVDNEIFWQLTSRL